MPTAIEGLLRELAPQVLGALVRRFGHFHEAEDAVQEALLAAATQWPRDGLPDNPRGWLIKVGYHRMTDQLRSDVARRRREEAEGVRVPGDQLVAPAADAERGSSQDDTLVLLFLCCHPALTPASAIPLTLRAVGGLTTEEIAGAFLVPEATMAKRLTRAKQKIVQAGIPYRVPAAEELPDRLAGVAATVYLIFNEGYAAGAGADLVRVALTAEAVRLARLLAELMPDEPTVLGLLALLVLHDARRESRVDAAGLPVLLADQDRGKWDTAAIKEGVELVGRALRRTADRPDVYVVQAAIAACHALAPSYSDTNWAAVISWYDVLLSVKDNPVARLNRAVAVSERDGPAAGLAIVDDIGGLTGYPWWHATRAELLRRLGDTEPARAAYHRALALDLSQPQAEHLRRRLAELT